MASDSFADIWGSVLLRCPDAGALFAQNIVRNAYRRLYKRRRWSWLIKPSQFVVPQLINAGTVAVTIGSQTVVGTGTAFDSSMVGLQFRVATTGPIYDIQAVTDATHLTLSLPWAFTQSFTSVGYQIYRCFFTPPSDFHEFVSLWDPNYNWQLNLNVDQRTINAYDAQRANFQQAYVVSFRDYSQDAHGNPVIPRYELWPHNQTKYVYPFLYVMQPPDVSGANVVLPQYITGDVLMEMSIEDVARWPGTTEKPNPYFNIPLAQTQAQRVEKLLMNVEVQDDEVYVQSVQYDISQLPFAPLPWGDSAWLQSHAI